VTPGPALHGRILSLRVPPFCLDPPAALCPVGEAVTNVGRRRDGTRWSQLRHGIAVEHLLSHVATELLGNHGDHRAPGAPTNPRGVVLACVPGELHELPPGRPGRSAQGRGDHRDAARRHDAPRDARRGSRAPPASGSRPHAMLPEPADPTLLDRVPTGTTSFALGPGWHPHPVPTHVARIDSLTAALDGITALLAEPGAGPTDAP
jgi:MerR family transcriptional regulator, light-induced transcriptional regulator